MSTSLDRLGLFSQHLIFILDNNLQRDFACIGHKRAVKIYAFYEQVTKKRNARANKRDLSVRVWCERLLARRMSKLMCDRGPIPGKRGAGVLTTRVVIDSSFGCSVSARPTRERLPRSYGYVAYDFDVSWHVPQGFVLREVDGKVVAVRFADRNRDGPVSVHVAVKSRGYSGRWDDRWWLYRGRLIRNAEVYKIAAEKRRCESAKA